MENSNQLRVLIADDHPLFLDGIRQMVEEAKDMWLVAECTNGDQTYERIMSLRPDVALLDVVMHGMSTTEIVRSIVAAGLPTRAVMLTAYGEPKRIAELLEAGAAGCLRKETPRAAIAEAIRRVAAGDTVLGHEVQTGLVQFLRDKRELEKPLLTERELECLKMLAEGLNQAAMAERLVLSQATIKSHLRTLYQNLGVSSGPAAVYEGMRRSLVQ